MQGQHFDINFYGRLLQSFAAITWPGSVEAPAASVPVLLALVSAFGSCALAV